MSRVLQIYTDLQLGFKLFWTTSVLWTSTKVLSVLILMNLRYGSLLSQKSNQESVFNSLTALHFIWMYSKSKKIITIWVLHCLHPNNELTSRLVRFSSLDINQKSLTFSSSYSPKCTASITQKIIISPIIVVKDLKPQSLMSFKNIIQFKSRTKVRIQIIGYGLCFAHIKLFRWWISFEKQLNVRIWFRKHIHV